MLKIDAHQHFWIFDPVRDSWINDEMSVIQSDFLPADLQPVLQQAGIDGCVAVQADQTEAQNDFLLELAEKNDFIKGVVGWVDLQAPNIDERLAYYSNTSKMKGFRHVLQGEPQRDFMLRPAFKHGISRLHNHGFTYDILIFPDQLEFTREFVATFPEQKFVIDHIAKPFIKDQKIDDWKKDIQAVAAYRNVWCKLSGMVTEADWKGWKKEDFTPYLDAVVEAFGPQRIMYGSDWPVCLVAADYPDMIGIVKDYFASFSQDEQDAFFGGNAVAFYDL
ncbi:amidohydrolase family protein [Paraflavisolibacter sp. H34]|uniref:amidohydrolase family protein n=1 Tax=Huijunlia imazamoxiresistens TaxID=3127457 RepID=UPI003016D406